MATPRFNHTLQKLIYQSRRLYRRTTRAFVNWVLRGLFVVGRSPFSTSGFVLPTVVLLLLILSLTVGAISYRSFTRTSDVISDRQQRVIYNSATPAIDRAKAKLEFLFDPLGDPRRPGGVPGEDVLLNMMYNDGRGDLDPADDITRGGDDYTFPDETRVDLDGDGEWDNAWRYPVDRDGDGTNDAWNIYSIIFRTPKPSDPGYAGIRLTTDPNNPSVPIGIDDEGMAQRANQLMVRNAPLSNTFSTTSACTSGLDTDRGVLEGWFPNNGTPGQVRKNFQVDALVVPFNEAGEFPAGSPISSLEFQQDRVADTGNKWGAWFRNDLEIFPGPAFTWNGAMHTRGSFFVGDSSSFRSVLISAPESCVYDKDASRITMAEFEENEDNNVPAFQGQFINGTVKANKFNGSSTINLYDKENPQIGTRTMNAGGDTVTAGSNATAFSLDPVKLLTEDVSQSRGWAENQGNNNLPSDSRDPAWADSAFTVDRNRIYNKTEEVPYVDDQYRADNRWGPKPRVRGINAQIPLAIPDAPVSADNPNGYDIGVQIEGDKLAAQELPDEELIRTAEAESPSQADVAENLGLDGYWERRADYQGLKLIVGQRLELGNNMGWGGVDGRGIPALAQSEQEASSVEPLRPWNSCTGADGNVRANANRCNEARQRRMLRDNLAAVQAMAVYHFADKTDGMPLACMASTVHPGTPDTLAKSATFANWNPDGFSNLQSKYPLAISNFFLGAGTNGWDFEPPVKSDFVNLETPMMKALQNLAHYAGDPKGGAPSFPPVTNDSTVHPYPSMAMWGDFSILRRVIELMKDGTDYDALSPADQATLHTAACTIGMLAYNIDYLDQLYGSGLSNGDVSLTSSIDSDVRAELRQLSDAIGAIKGKSITGFDPQIHTPDNYIYGLKGDTSLNNTNGRKLIALAEMLATKEQVRRDRLAGFAGVYGANAIKYGDTPKGKSPYFSQSCQAFLDDTNLKNLIELCSDYPKYPILAALFGTQPNKTEATAAPILRDLEDRNNYSTYIRDVNQGFVYYRLTPAEVSEIALKPRPLNQWKLPYIANTSSTDTDFSPVQPNNPNHPNLLLLKQCVVASDICIEKDQSNGASLFRVAFKDAALFNGREMMTARTLDLDLDILRKTAIGNSYWLPAEERAGVIYAFREDGVREGSIVRPPSSDWATCGTTTALETNAACRMNTTPNAYQSTDPPPATNGISTKPVDFYADPDRRPFAFRLKNGKSIERPEQEIAGMTFVSDNAVYIQGDFNFHRSGGAEVQEFNQLLDDNSNNFYTRGNSGLNNKFARPKTDQWRPAEILADAITILPINFCDGSILDTFGGAVTGNTTANYGCSNSNNITSFGDQNLPNQTLGTKPSGSPGSLPDDGWLRENPLGSNKNRSPVRVSRDGNPVLVAGSYTNKENYNDVQEYGVSTSQRYLTFWDSKSLITAPNRTEVNAVIVSGLVPSRTGQSYGGLHNFPRFISNWGSRRLYIKGSIIQLSFSNAATAPFDQEAWEVGQTPTTDAELIKYYNPPSRLWGYDVALQYASPGPLSARFAGVEDSRSEFYSEPALDDPYIVKLCKAMQAQVTNLPCE